MDTIEADNYGSSKRLAGLLDSWLRRWSSNQSIPSWRVLCKAITMVDRSRADAIANKHQCNCSQCTSELILSYMIILINVQSSLKL